MYLGQQNKCKTAKKQNAWELIFHPSLTFLSSPSCSTQSRWPEQCSDGGIKYQTSAVATAVAIFGTRLFFFFFSRAWCLYVHSVWQCTITCRQGEAGSVTSDTPPFPLMRWAQRLPALMKLAIIHTHVCTHLLLVSFSGCIWHILLLNLSYSVASSWSDSFDQISGREFALLNSLKGHFGVCECPIV